VPAFAAHGSCDEHLIERGSSARSTVHSADIDSMAAGSPGGVVSAGDAQAFAQVRNTSE
jgi:hypothetical protein